LTAEARNTTGLTRDWFSLLVRELRRTKLLAHVVERVAAVVAEHAVDTPGSRKVTDVRVRTILSHATQIRARYAEHGLTPDTQEERIALRRQRNGEAHARWVARRGHGQAQDP
jgi:hypothetical protein